jgi:hypothetical protein
MRGTFAPRKKQKALPPIAIANQIVWLKSPKKIIEKNCNVRSLYRSILIFLLLRKVFFLLQKLGRE